ncbi:MAG: outer membrane PBP1 activator LpoA protein [Lentisphaeria bacterium]|jgi:outer membrane PBP1 activator LpoA protein
MLMLTYLSRTSLLRALVVTLISLFVFACGTSPVKETAPSERVFSLESVTATLDDADKQSPAARAQIYLDVIDSLLQLEEIDWARYILTQLSSAAIPEKSVVDFSIVSAKLALAQGQPFLAKRYLWSENIVTRTAPAPIEQQVSFHEIRAQLLYSIAEYRDSIAERLVLHSLISDNENNEANQDLIWQSLMELPYSELVLESKKQDHRLTQGWYTLAALSKNNQTNLRLQFNNVESWAINWPDHPASLRLPADLQLLQQLVDKQPRQIAILLPLSGNFELASQAIRDGFMAAFYQARSLGDTLPDLRFYDSAANDINILYDKAVLSGAQIIIGPLEQSKIAELAVRPELPVPVLALNRLVGENDSATGLFQFGLPLEDEAEQTAEQAWRDGHRRALVLAPSTANGDRGVLSFSERWKELGGELINDYRFQAQATYSSLIKQAVKVSESQKRKKQVRGILGKPIEFEPRRRQDIDFIFAYANAAQARQLKPILKFHYSGDVPVYALKDIYNGDFNTKTNSDLNDVRFTTIPWYFTKQLPEKLALERGNNSPNFQTLYALGVDTYHIYPRLKQLALIKQAHFYGATGTLSLDEKQKIKRQQMWAIFSKGVAQPMVTFTENSNF